MHDIRPALWVAALALSTSLGNAAPAQPLPTILAETMAGPMATAFDASVEAVRHTVVAAQVPGAIVQLHIQAGDRVQAGQLLLRIDARAADQNVAASTAQVQAAHATLALAARDFERQQQLFQKNYISAAALERAETIFKSAQAQASAQLAQASASRTHSGYHAVRAPFDGVVADVPVSLGDMAMPGRPLLTLYDPAALRVTAAVPQSLATSAPDHSQLRIELPGMPAGRSWIAPVEVQVMPTVDAATHTVQLRATLPKDMAGATPGMFARLWLPAAHSGSAATVQGRLLVPLQAIVRRAELTALYVLNPDGKPLLRQVRLGRSIDGRVEVLSGLMPGEAVVADPQAAPGLR